jgi:hypothetical protein
MLRIARIHNLWPRPLRRFTEEHRVLRRSIFAVKLNQADRWLRLAKAAGIRVE